MHTHRGVKFHAGVRNGPSLSLSLPKLGLF